MKTDTGKYEQILDCKSLIVTKWSYFCNEFSVNIFWCKIAMIARPETRVESPRRLELKIWLQFHFFWCLSSIKLHFCYGCRISGEKITKSPTKLACRMRRSRRSCETNPALAAVVGLRIRSANEVFHSSRFTIR